MIRTTTMVDLPRKSTEVGEMMIAHKMGEMMIAHKMGEIMVLQIHQLMLEGLVAGEIVLMIA